MYRKMLSIMLIDVLQMLSWLKCSWQGILNLSMFHIFLTSVVRLYSVIVVVFDRGWSNSWSMGMICQNLLYIHHPSCILFFGEWNFHFFLLNKCKRVCWRYQERITKSINFNFDVLTTTICSFLIPAITSLLNNIISSVCNWNLMVTHRTCNIHLATWFRTLVYANPFNCKFGMDGLVPKINNTKSTWIVFSLKAKILSFDILISISSELFLVPYNYVNFWEEFFLEQLWTLCILSFFFARRVSKLYKSRLF